MSHSLTLDRPLRGALRLPTLPLLTLLTLLSGGSLLLAWCIGWLVLQLVRQSRSMSSELQGALRRGEMQVLYQPIFELTSRNCVGEVRVTVQHTKSLAIAGIVDAPFDMLARQRACGGGQRVIAEQTLGSEMVAQSPWATRIALAQMGQGGGVNQRHECGPVREIPNE